MAWRRAPVDGTGSARLAHRFARVPLLVVVAASVCLAATPKAFAFGSAAPCTSRDTSAAFARWLDPAQYFLASNGGFENGAADRNLNAGAAVAAGNEPYQLAGASDAHYLSLPAGSSAESRTACVEVGEATVRLLVDVPNVAGATLTVDASVVNPTTGLTLDTRYVVVSRLTPAGWTPTPEIVVPNLLGGILPENLTLRITAGGAPATWGVDDVYVDPFKHR